MRRLPVQVPPQKDEIFLSWFVRLAHAHGERVQALAHQMWGRSRMLGAGSVFKIEGEHLLPVSEATGLDLEVLEGLTLGSLVGRLWEEISDKGARKWVLPTVDRRRKGERFGQQVCPGCLRDDPVPYFRRTWRLAFCAICPQHRATLIDRCDCCDSPILLDRLDIGMFVPTDQAVAYKCWRCGSDFRDIQLTEDVNDDLVESQLLLLDCLRRGWINLNGRVVYSTRFFDGLWTIWSMLDSHLQSGELLRARETGIPGGGQSKAFVHRGVSRRRELLERSGLYVRDWPDPFIRDASSAKLMAGRIFGYSRQSRPAKEMPFWLWEPVHFNLDGTMYVPSDEEIGRAIRWIHARDGRLRSSEVAAILNMRSLGNARVRNACLEFQRELYRLISTQQG